MHGEFAAFDWIAAPVLVVDAEGRIVRWNAACAALTGHAFEDVRGRRALSFLATPEEAEEAARTSSSLATVLQRQAERSYTSQTGEHRWLAWRATPVVLPDAIEYIVVLGVDVTDRKRAEDAVLTSQATLGGIISIAADAIISVDSHQRIVIFNQGAEEIFGYSAAEVLGEPLDLIVPDRFRHIHREHVRAFAATPERARPMGQRNDVFGRRKNGEEFPAEAAISKLKVEGRTMFTVVLRDTTGRKRAELRQQFLMEASDVLASSIEYQETLRTVAKLAVGSLADTCLIDILDPQTERVSRFAVVAAAPVPRTLDEYTIDRARAHLTRSALERGEATLMPDVPRTLLESLVQGDELRSVVLELTPTSLIVVPLLAHERVLGAVALLSGPTRRPYGPEELRLAEELARRAALAVDNAILYSAAQSAIRTREEILAVVSHDLRSLLSQTLMGASQLEAVTADQGARKTIGIVRRSAERMTRLVEDLLDFASVAARRLAIKRSPTRARDLVSEAMALLQPIAASHAQRLHVEIPKADLVVLCDAGRILQVLSNLIGNAMKYTPEGGTIAVRVEPRQGELWFAVADSGPGIPQPEQRHVFDRYWRGSVGARPGSGLGLAIASGIVEAHAGRIWVESEVGVGSTFWFALPMPAQVTPAASAGREKAAP